VLPAGGRNNEASARRPGADPRQELGKQDHPVRRACPFSHAAGSSVRPLEPCGGGNSCPKGLVEDVNEMRIVKARLEEARRAYPNVGELVRADAFRRLKTPV
jgi:hypothetical protein